LTASRGIGEVINLGSNYEISVEETAKSIAEIMNSDVEFYTDEQRLRPKESEVDRLWACNRKAKEILGWTPNYGGLEGFKKGLAETISWFRDESNLSKYKANKYNI
jgi:dTDP-glucose 4,6-dehydratase